MRFKILAGTCVAASLIVFSPNVHAASSASVKTAIQKLYNSENAAAADKDVDGMLAYTSPNFDGVDDKGNRITYSDLHQSTEQLCQTATSIEASTVIDSCKVTGDKAVLEVSDQTKVEVSGGDSGNTTLEDKDKSTDTWTKTSAGWRLTGSRVLSHSATIDGQPAPDLPGS